MIESRTAAVQRTPRGASTSVERWISAGLAVLVVGSINISWAPVVLAQTTATPVCADAPPANGKSRQLFDSAPLLYIATELERQGESEFHLKYDAPQTECVVETFSVGDVAVTATYQPWSRGASTLLYRFRVSRPEGPSEVLVLYNGTASALLDDKPVFHVSEERGGVISWYAMFKEEPTFAAAKAIVQAIVGGQASPLMAVRWPAGAREGEVVTFDSKRLRD